MLDLELNITNFWLVSSIPPAIFDCCKIQFRGSTASVKHSATIRWSPILELADLSSMQERQHSTSLSIIILSAGHNAVVIWNIFQHVKLSLQGITGTYSQAAVGS